MHLHRLLAATFLSSLLAAGCGPSLTDDRPEDLRDYDGDTIADYDENRDLETDMDGDGTPDYRDEDSDDDCIPDRLEAGDDDLDTLPIDSDSDGVGNWRDRDSDGDGLADGDEDKNCDGKMNGDETDAHNADTDGDGVSDLIEVAAETDPHDPADNPQANGDFVFVVPFEQDPIPADDDLNFSTALQSVDLYVLADLSGSMNDELSSIRNNMSNVLSNLACPPLGTGTPGECIPDLWSGLGTLTYAGRDPYVHRIDIQPNPAVIGSNLPGTDNGNCPNGNGSCVEPHMLAAFSAVTGQGSASSGCFGTEYYNDRSSCTGSPAGPDGVGYPCFRQGALPVVLLATDEPPSTQFACPGFNTLAAAAAGIGAKIMGIKGNPDGGVGNQLTSDLNTIANSTGAVDSSGNPLVFNGYNSSASSAIEQGIRTLANGVPLTVSGHATDDASDGVDAVAAFVGRLETFQAGTPECTEGLADQDSNGDGFPDVYTSVVSGTPVCWKLHAKRNETVQGESEPRLYQATVDVYGDGVTLLDQRRVFFVVPPQINIVD